MRFCKLIASLVVVLYNEFYSWQDCSVLMSGKLFIEMGRRSAINKQALMAVLLC